MVLGLQHHFTRPEKSVGIRLLALAFCLSTELSSRNQIEDLSRISVLEARRLECDDSRLLSSGCARKKTTHSPKTRNEVARCRARISWTHAEINALLGVDHELTTAPIK